ncbi:MAG TPA: glycyl-radical enzyme activating protein [Rectinemataceae bacterium]|nr:glycyl-radical enzyme activating protein [Rectinemataceae bacterium]
MDGNIIDIRRFTLHDGYGIRSTVFLKGCGLRCAWCHNPEGIENAIGLWYLPGQCIHCRSCLGACPENALSAGDGDQPSILIDRRRCTLCGRCVDACPTTALSFDGRRLSGEAVAEILLRDREFYLQSGGGITISGGDPLIQHRFAAEILGRCRAAGVHTAIETCLQGSWDIIETLLPLVDLFIADLKLADPRLHREYTGQDNSLIRENYHRLSGLAPDMLTRIPLIPRVTALPENIRALARFIGDCRPGGRVELINFNPLAPNKYRLMNRDQEFFRGMAPLGAEELAKLQAILEAEGLTTVREHRT